MIIVIKSALAHIIPMLPILGAGVVEGQDVAKLSTASVISRLLELAILGGIFLYTTVQVMNSKIEVIEKFMDKHEVQCVASREKIAEIQLSLLLLNYKHNESAADHDKISNQQNFLSQ